jgi:hypothetical protein
LNKTGFAIICFGLVVVLCAAFFLSDTLGSGLCVNKVSKEILSPNGQLKAVVFKRDCGSPSGSQLSLLSAGDALNNKPGNVLPQDESIDDVHWEGDGVLSIRYANGPKTYVKEDTMWVVRLPFPAQVTLKTSR